MTYPGAAILFDAAIAVKCFGVGVSYLIIIGDLMPGVIRGFNEHAGEVAFLVSRRFWVTAFMYAPFRPLENLLTLPRLMVIPLSFLRRLDSLKYTSVIALTSIGYLVVLVVYHFVEGDTLDRKGPVHVFEPNGFASALSTFPVIVFAYTCHQNVR